MGKYSVKNHSSGPVTLLVSDLRFRRELAPGRVIPISEEEFNELSYDAGVQALLRGGFISFIGETPIEKEHLEEVLGVTSEPVVDLVAIKKIIDSKNITEFARLITKATQATKDSVVEYATKVNLTDPAFVTLIKKYCDVDLINAITYKRQAEE